MRTRAIATRLLSLILVAAGWATTSCVLAEEAAKPAVVAEATPAMVQQGRDLFLGTTRFSAGGPACNACHNVVNDAVPGGGSLAVDVTKSFTRMGADGINDVLPKKGAESPFPVMQVAFQGRELTAEEATALAAFLQDADAKAATQKPNDAGTRMVSAGVIGVVVLLLLFSLLGQGRKRRSVNQDIYDRQVMSE